MPWGAVAGAVVSYGLNEVGKDGSNDKNGGAGTQTQTKAPWAAAQPWITNNMNQGQALQDKYTAQPFNAQQQQAYANQYAQSDYMRSLVPSLLNQMQGQQVGFDRTNQQSNKQKAWDWGLMGQGGQGGAGVGGTGGGLMAANGTMAAAQQLQDALDAANKKKPEEQQGDFRQQEASADPMTQYWSVLRGQTDPTTIQDKAGIGRPSGMTGGYGTFKYGDAIPEPGTKAYRDYQEYFQYGGKDPYGFYGRQSQGYTPYASENGNTMGMQTQANPQGLMGSSGMQWGNSGLMNSGK